MVFSPDGKRLASAASDNTVKVWDAQTGQELLTFKVNTRRFSNVAFSPDSKRLASSSIPPDASGPPGSDEVKVWDAQTGDELLTLKGHTGFVWSVVFSPDGKRLASVAGWVGIPWEVKVWDVHTGQELLSLKGGDGDAGSLAFSPTGHWLTTNAGVSRPLTVWDATPLPEK